MDKTGGNVAHCGSLPVLKIAKTGIITALVTRLSLYILVALCAIVLPGCTDKGGGRSRDPLGASGSNRDINGRKVSEPAIIRTVGGEAAEVYRRRCATCHGTGGLGDGIAAAGLRPAPRSFGDRTWQKSITDEHLKKVIIGGGLAVGKSPLMVANPDLADRRATLEGLVKIIRGLQVEPR